METTSGGAVDDVDRTGPDRTGRTSAERASGVDVGDGPACPFCGSTDTERHAAFGCEVSAEQHYCHGCHTVFERIKFDGASADAGRRPGTGR